MKHPVAFPGVHENSEAKRNKFRAGVRAYALDYYVPEYVPSDTDLLCAFRIEPLQGVDMIEASAAVAAESSTGTWTEVWSNQLTDMDLFEENSVVNIMSSIVGNVFGFKAVKLREAMELWGKVKFGASD